MFCRIEIKKDKVIVTPSRLGLVLKRLTLGLIVPPHTFRRDFGPGSADGRCLEVKGACSVTIIGRLM